MLESHGDLVVDLSHSLYAFEWSYVPQWGLIVILIMMSGMFSGLNLGLMSLDKVSLEIVIGSGSAAQSKYARRIYPIRRRGNLLLCTILLGNVSVNALLSILLADFTSGLVGFLSSTILIVVCGEIFPQAVCSRYGLLVGYYTVWIVWIFLIVLLPLSYPISKILDFALGHEVGTIYTRTELKKLFDIHTTYSDITREEANVLSGALEFGSMEVQAVMTPLDKVFMLGIDTILNRDTIKLMLQKGFSRIPVYEGSPDIITGLLFVKDLALLNPDDNLSVRKVLPTLGRNFPRVFNDTRLSQMLEEFKKGQSHIAVVRRVVEHEDSDPTYENVGIVTLEDVIEEILQDEIVDETDVYVDNTSYVSVGRAHIEYGNITEDSRSEEYVKQAYQLLRLTPEFSDDLISDDVLIKLLQQSGVSDIGPHDGEIYSEGKHKEYMTIVLKGSMQIEGMYGSLEQMPGSTIGMSTLTNDHWIPDFSARATCGATTMKISRRAYTTAVQATQFERGQDPELIVDDF